MSLEHPLKIGYLVQQFPPEVGAGPARVSEMALRWKDAGAEVTVITGMPNRPQGRIHPEYRGRLFSEEDWNGIQVLRSWLFARPRHGTATTIMNTLSFAATGTLHALFRARGLDVLIASSPPFFVHPGGEVLRRLQRIPLVLEVRDLWPDYIAEMGIFRSSLIPAMLLRLERALMMRATRVVVVTEDIRKRVVAKGVHPSRVRMVTNGVDPASYYRSSEEPPLPALHRRGDEFVVGYLGNLGAGQQLETIVEAASILADDDPAVRFVLAGDGTQRARVEAAISELRPTNLSIHPAISKASTRAFYNACDLALVPLAPLKMFLDALPTKLFEIMACETPVLAALEGQGAEMVRSAACGAVATPGSATSIVQAIREIRSWDPSRRAAAGQNGRNYVVEHFSRDSLAAAYLELLLEVAGGSSGPRSGARRRATRERRKSVAVSR
jgi:glycosyltransferase involved in cell wall biosynthesis